MKKRVTDFIARHGTSPESDRDTTPPPVVEDPTEPIPESVYDEVRGALRHPSLHDSAREMRAAVASMDAALEHLTGKP